MDSALLNGRANKKHEGRCFKKTKKIILDTESGFSLCPDENCKGIVFPIRDAQRHFILSGYGKCINCGAEYEIRIREQKRGKHRRCHKKIEASLKRN